MDINFREVLAPVPGYEIWDYFAYAIFAFSLIAIVLAGDDTSTLTTILFGVVLIGAIFDKIYFLGYMLDTGLPPNVTPTLEIRVATHVNSYWSIVMRGAMLFCVALATSQTKSKRARVVGMLLILMVFAYALGRWWDQDGSSILTQGL